MMTIFSSVPGRVWDCAAKAAMICVIAVLGFGGFFPEPQLATADPGKPEPVQLAAAQFQNRPLAPDFEDGMDWLNTEKPLNLEALRGRIVLLDFWTLC
jgi:hypothetical protein